METCPTDIWQEIFELACTDTGYTGRSLSLVSKYVHDISGPFKYQSLAITPSHPRQIIAFSKTFSQLPDSQKKIKYLFVNCPYHPLVVGPRDTFNSNILEAFRAILNETSSTLIILGVYWMSEAPPLIHTLLPPLPWLQELHLYRSNVSSFYDTDGGMNKETTTTLFPLLRFLYISGDDLQAISFSDYLARLAPNLTHLRIPYHYDLRAGTPQNPTHPFNLHLGGIIVERWQLLSSWKPTKLRNQFETSIQIGVGDLEKAPEPLDWQRW